MNKKFDDVYFYVQVFSSQQQAYKFTKINDTLTCKILSSILDTAAITFESVISVASGGDDPKYTAEANVIKPIKYDWREKNPSSAPAQFISNVLLRFAFTQEIEQAEKVVCVKVG